MNNILKQTLAFFRFFGKTTPTQAQTAETTGGGEESFAWVEVALNLSPLEADIMKGRLESLDIPVRVARESAGGVFGLTVGPLGWSSRLFVPEPLAEHALSILNEELDLSEDMDADDFETAFETEETEEIDIEMNAETIEASADEE